MDGVYDLLMAYKQYTKVTNRMYKHLETEKSWNNSYEGYPKVKVLDMQKYAYHKDKKKSE